MSPSTQKWCHTAVVYELYPSSFCDSTGTGTGDIRGIINKIPYLASLGIDAVWLAACYKSSGVDMGYDVVDYRAIDPQYGTVADVEELIAELKSVGIRLIMDWVANHTSDQHAWFQESRQNKNNSKRNWYIWRKGSTDAKGVKHPPNNWQSIFTGSAWTYDEKTDEWYLRFFAKEQPDLNWDNPDVREAVYNDMRFWLDKGVAGFRLDVINMISKSDTSLNAPIVNPGNATQPACHLFSCNGPRVHEYLQEMRREVLDKYEDVMTVGEVICTSDPKDVREYVEPVRKELDMVYVYDFFELDSGPTGKFTPRQYTPLEFKNLVVKMSTSLSYSTGGWQTVWLESHDSGRSVSRFGDRTRKNRCRVARMLALLESTLGGTLFIYQGQEIGMQNLSEDIPIEAYPDVETKRTWNHMLEARVTATGLPKEGIDMSEVAREARLKARDHARAPLPWRYATSEHPHAGFSTASSDVKTWSPMNTDSGECNIGDQHHDPGSVLSYWRRRIALRKRFAETVVFGDFEAVEATMNDGPVFAYWRKPLPGVQKVEGKDEDGVRDILVVLNLTPQEDVDFEMPVGYDGMAKRFFVLDSTAPVELGRGFGLVASTEKVSLKAYHGVVFGF